MAVLWSNVSYFIPCLRFSREEMQNYLQMETDDYNLGELRAGPPDSSHPFESSTTRSSISESEFSCHCCYDILVNPTTLNCGHNFCRHCLALWWESSHKNECPECREKWQGFPKVNILLRYIYPVHPLYVNQEMYTEIETIKLS